jgi:O-antigen ligase
MTLKEINLGRIGIFGFALFAPVSIAFSQMCIGITILGWITKMVQKKSYLWKKTPLDYVILFYVVIQIIAVLCSKDIRVAISGWINTDWFILFYYAIINQMDEESDYKRIIQILAVSGSVSAVYGIIQHFIGIDFIRGNENIWPYGDFFRATGFFNLPLTYGGVQLGIFLLLIPYFFLKDEIFNKKLFLCILLLLFYSIIASYARSAWLGFGAASLLLIFFLKKKYKFIVTAAAIVSLIVVYFVHPDLLFKYGVFSMFDVSENAPYNNLVRIKLWHSTWNMIKDNWLIGIGYSDFSEIMETYKVPFDYRGLTDPHNDYLKVSALSGIFGGIAFILLWVKDLGTKYIAFRKPQFLRNFTLWKAGSVGSFFAVFAFLVAALTQEYYHDAETAELWWFITALGMIGVLKKQNLKLSDSRRESFKVV